MRVLARIFLFAVLGAGSSCFDETSGNQACAGGEATCRCYGNGTCNGDLVCQDGVCRATDCRDGKQGCGCIDGLCLGTLVCQDNTCVKQSATGGTSTSTSTSTTGAPTTLTTGPITTGPDVTSTTLPTTGVTTDSTTEPATGPGTTGPLACQCGWAAPNKGYYCTQNGLSDPDGVFEKECPVGTMEGATCDSVMPPITAVEGCCLGAGVNAFCGALNTIVFEDCTALMRCTPE